ncbi:MAG: universal stress protein [Anaerolineales bacterium]|nr:universal stress protein [Anaerolineales bacterium]MCB9128458.1 universal stress protein [Ardenticatenales bacterium]
MAHVSKKLSNAFEGALAGGGDPATSPLYVFGPFLRLIVVAGVANITFGASVWMVVFTIAVVAAMYRLVMKWIIDGSGGSGLSEEEFGSWAVKVNAAITFIEYTLTFLVSMAALVTFIADRVPVLNEAFLGFQYRTFVAVALSFLTGWLVNLGPKVAARAFGPATAGVLLLLWLMIIATVATQGFNLPSFNLQAFSGEYLHFTLRGFASILAVMTGIEIFANLVAAYDGPPREKSRKAFNSLLIIMVTTALTMLIVGPAILKLSDPTNSEVSVFTQTMDQLLPAPLPYLGTIVGIAVLLSASAASAQGLQNLALGLRYRHYIPAYIGERNEHGVAGMPVWIEVAIVSLCFLAFGTNEETYLAIYAAGVFILLSMTGWAATKRIVRELRADNQPKRLFALIGTIIAAVITTFATVVIFEERFFEGAWTFFLFIPFLYVIFTYFRNRLGDPTSLEERMGLQYYSPFLREAWEERPINFDQILVPVNGSEHSARMIPMAQMLGAPYDARITLMAVQQSNGAESTSRRQPGVQLEDREKISDYLDRLARDLHEQGVRVETAIGYGEVSQEISDRARESLSDLIVISTHGRPTIERVVNESVAYKVTQESITPVLVANPDLEQWDPENFKLERVMVTLDGSEAAEKALPYAYGIAKQFGSEVILFSVPAGVDEAIKAEQMEQYLSVIAAALDEQGIKVRMLIEGAAVARSIVAAGDKEDVDLIIMTSHGSGSLDRLLTGSVTERVIYRANRPVLIVSADAPLFHNLATAQTLTAEPLPQ